MDNDEVTIIKDEPTSLDEGYDTSSQKTQLTNAEIVADKYSNFEPKDQLPILADIAIWDEDNYIFCDDCQKDYLDECPTHGPLNLIPDTPVHDTEADHPEFAERTTPTCLRVAPSAIVGAGLGVWTAEKIPARSYFGPYSGVITSEPTNESYGWQKIVKSRSGYRVMYIDGSDPSKSNWMRYVNCARNFAEQNLIAYQFKHQVYYAVLRDIPAYQELYVFYDDKHAEELGIDVSRYFDKMTDHLLVQKFNCHVCHRDFTSPVERDEHSSRCTGSEESREVPYQRTLRSSTIVVQESSTIVVQESSTIVGQESSAIVGQETSSIVAQKSTLLACSFCSDQFEDKSGLVGHLQSIHFACPICERRFSRRSHLKSHIGSHQPKSCFTCCLCNNFFLTRRILREHLPRCRPGPYHCTQCDSSFSKRSSLRSHTGIHTRQSVKVQSRGKPKRIRIKNEPEISKVRKKKPQTVRRCPICPAQFTQQREFERHVNKHARMAAAAEKAANEANNKSESSVEKVSEGSDREVSDLVEPTSVQRSENAPSGKEERSSATKLARRRKRVPSKPSLKSRIRRRFVEGPANLALTSDRYHCPNCPRQFNKLISLALHTRVHKKENNTANRNHIHSSPTRRGKGYRRDKKRTYKCRSCQSKFTSIKSFESHSCLRASDPVPVSTESDVPTENANRCQICSAQFVKAAGLSAHMRMHKRQSAQTEAENQVDLTRSKKRKRHVERDAKTSKKRKVEDIFRCPVCPALYNSKYAFNAHMHALKSTHMRIFSCSIDANGDIFYTCNDCGAGAYSVRSMKLHLYEHARKPTKSVKIVRCPKCSKIFASMRGLIKHIPAFH